MSPTFLAYEIVQNNKERGMKFYANATDFLRLNGPELERESELARENCDLIYGGNHIVIRHWEGSGPQPTKTVTSRRESREQRDIAFAAILDGPDTKTKRWLSQYMARKDKSAAVATPRQGAIAAKKAKEPVQVGTVIDDGIPF